MSYIHYSNPSPAQSWGYGDYSFVLDNNLKLTGFDSVCVAFLIFVKTTRILKNKEV
jgi:hypothetical protein